MEVAAAFEVAAEMVRQGADVVVEVRHPGKRENDSNVEAPPEATVRLLSGAGLPGSPGIPQKILRTLIDREDVDLSVVSSDFQLT